MVIVSKMERDNKHSLEIRFGKDTDTRGKQKRDKREREGSKRETREREREAKERQKKRIQLNGRCDQT